MAVQTPSFAPSSALVPGYLMPGPERARHWLGQLLVFIGITGILLPIAWIALTDAGQPANGFPAPLALG
jgi:hypothetical protein